MPTIPMTAACWPAVRTIYAEDMATGTATFAAEPPAWQAWDSGRLVATAGGSGRVLGWVARTPVSSRCAGVAAVSAYGAAAARGRCLALMQTLVMESEQNAPRKLQAGIFSEHTASLRLPEAVGFRVMRRRERIGQVRGVWPDALLRKRRSATVGTTLTAGAQ